MKNFLQQNVIALFALFAAACSVAYAAVGDTNIKGRVVIYGPASLASTTCATATGGATSGDLCVDGDIEGNLTLDIGGTATLRGAVNTIGALNPTGGITTTVQSGANVACTTTCGSHGCIFGWDSAAKVPIVCSDATADSCLCGN